MNGLVCGVCGGTTLSDRAVIWDALAEGWRLTPEERTMAGEARTYGDDYWSEELKAARERGYGASPFRAAEVFYYARRPAPRFLDISRGADTLLDAPAELLPESADTFWGIEPFPPPPAFRAKHPNYRIGFVRDLEGKFVGGTCIEVIECLEPPILRSIHSELASVSSSNALCYFNSAQPEFVARDDLGYLDPYDSGHIASYSVEGLRPVFAEAGFAIHALPGRDWAFLAEYAYCPAEDGNTLLDRIWQMHPENRALLSSARFGHLLLASGMESGRCYIEAGTAAWAVEELQKAH
jgi:hypothetical protein